MKDLNHTYVVFSEPEVSKYCSTRQIRQLRKLSNKIQKRRKAEGLKEVENYYVCNVNNPNAHRVLQLIREGNNIKVSEEPTYRLAISDVDVPLLRNWCELQELEFESVTKYFCIVALKYSPTYFTRLSLKNQLELYGTPEGDGLLGVRNPIVTVKDLSGSCKLVNLKFFVDYLFERVK